MAIVFIVGVVLCIRNSLGIGYLVLIRRSIQETIHNDCAKGRDYQFTITHLPVEDQSVQLFCTELIQMLNLGSTSRSEMTTPTGMTIIKTLDCPFSSVPVIGVVLFDEDDRLWVVFRGTETREEVKQDLEYYLTPSNHQPASYSVHTGFMTIFDCIKNSVDSILAERKPVSVIITGHSLGAAVSTLVAFFLSRKYPETMFTGYVFGSPRVGDPRFASLFNHAANINWFNLVNLYDIIPTLPLAVMPNPLDPSRPFLYESVGNIQTFATNWGSVLANHLLPVYNNQVNTGNLH